MYPGIDTHQPGAIKAASPRKSQAAALRCAAYTRTTAMIFVVLGVIYIPKLCGAFVWSPPPPRMLQLHDESVRRCPVSGTARAHTGCDAAREKEEKDLRLLTWMEVEARIKREIAETGTAAVLVPVGATEQHGPNGLIGTDHLTAEAVARGVSETTSAILAPTVNYGMSHHHQSFPGTVTLRPSTFVAVMRDIASSLSKMGFTHVLFINGHGGNVGPAFKAFAEFATDEGHDQQRQEEGSNNGSTTKSTVGSCSSNGRARVKLISWYAGRESSALAKELYGSEVGQHATPDEVAVTQHLFPDSIKNGVELDPAAIQVAKDIGGMTKRFKDEETGLPVMDVADFRRRFPDGRMFSNPGLATPEHGRRLLKAAISDAAEALGKFLSGQDLVEEAEMKAKRAAAAKAAEPGAADGNENTSSKTQPRRDSNQGNLGGAGDGSAAEDGNITPIQPPSTI